MKKEFKPIAMRCTQEQFEDIKKDLIKNNIHIVDSFAEITPIYDFLINNYSDDENIRIGSWVNDGTGRRIVHEQWNKNIFLEACGIETKYKISKETILKYKMKYEFPEMFEVELEAGKWYKSLKHTKQIINIVEFKDIQHIKAYGFDTYGEWASDDNKLSWGLPSDGNYREATNKEIETALITEAKKRGFKEGDFVYSVYDSKEYKLNNRYFAFCQNELRLGGVCIFKAGIWAEIIKPKQMTQSDIEKELGYKVEIIK